MIYKIILIWAIYFGSMGLLYAQNQCPVNNSCTPSSAPLNNTAFGMGIYRVHLSNLDTTTNGSIDGYRDYSCLRRASLVQGSTYTLRVQTGLSAAENVVAWIDYNNDGTFAPIERVLYSLNAQSHAANFTVPVTATRNQPLRLRIAADYANAPIPTACSTPQYSQTEDYQVRIAAGNAAPVARFTSPDTISCNGVVAFRDASANAPTTWYWQFGDGGTSIQQHPTHTYAAAGTYAVRLRACNGGGCDSLARAAYVRVRTDGPRAASCQPATTAYCCQFGLTRLRLAGLDHASADGQAGYEDFSCAYRATLTADQPYTLQLTTGPNPHDVRVYLDLNDDGQFTGATELLYQGLAVHNPAVPLNLASALGLVYNRALRLRIVADVAGGTGTGPCNAVQSGQAEDYSVVLVPNIAHPTAAFTLLYQQLCGPVRVSLANTTTGGATSYAWDFGDGSTSSLASPTPHTYATPGVYELRLVAQNAFGRDTIRQRVAVATACSTYCQATPNGGTNLAPAYFTRFQFADLDNADPRILGVGYRDFTDRIANVQAGQAYQLRAESLPYPNSSNGPWNAVVILIDYNQDGVFSESERTRSSTQYSPHTLSIRIPPWAKSGATRMRAVVYGAYQSQYVGGCLGSFLTGAVEDYTLLVMPPPVAPQVGFLTDLATTCNGLVQFRDTSWSAPSNWLWRFGDGATATVQHPLHQYAATGTYTVSLQAGNAYGSRTLSRPAAVTVGALTGGARPASCLPSPVVATTLGQHGIDTLTIGTAFRYHQPINSPGYRDETCTRAAIALGQGTVYPLRFVDSNTFTTSCYVWLDSNNNGVFDAPSELVFNSLTASYNLTSIFGLLTVPATAVTGQPLRLRVIQWHYPDGVPRTTPPSPCNNSDEGGQVRDFSVQIIANPLAVSTGATPAAVGHWQVAPNPSTGRVTVFGPFAQPMETELWDAVGRCVYRASVSPDAQANLVLDFGALPRGVYLLRLNGGKHSARLSLE